MRRIARLLFLAALPCACDLTEELKDQPCDVDDDCWPKKQHCARTEPERQADLPGVCKPKDIACVPGQQLGCPCSPTEYDMSCMTAAVPAAIEYPVMVCDEVQLVCVVEPMDATSEEG